MKRKINDQFPNMITNSHAWRNITQNERRYLILKRGRVEQCIFRKKYIQTHTKDIKVDQIIFVLLINLH